MPDLSDEVGTDERQYYKVLAPIRTRQKVDPSTGKFLGSGNIALPGDILLLSDKEATAIADIVEMIAKVDAPVGKAPSKTGASTGKSSKPITPDAAT